MGRDLFSIIISIRLDWQLRGHWDLCCAHPLDRRCAVCCVDDTLLLSWTLRVGLDQNGRIKRQIASWEPNKWNGMNEIQQLPVSFFFPVSNFHYVPFQISQEIRFILLYTFLHLTAICAIICAVQYTHMITLPLNVCLNCAYKIDVWVFPAIVKSPSNWVSLASKWSMPSACSVDKSTISSIDVLTCMGFWYTVHHKEVIQVFSLVNVLLC